MGRMSDRERTLLLAYYGWIKASTCASCRVHGTLSNPIEAAHIRTIVSAKTGDYLPRSHKGLAAWGALPLCKRCHTEVHEIGEERFIQERLPKAHAIVTSGLLGFWLEREGHDDES